ncbi:MAG: response regulator [Alphaproteobacteria bacterium]
MALAENQKKTTILAIDDASENLYIIKEILTPEHRVLLAVDPGAALDVAESQQPDLILLDIVMPNINGYEVCKKLKANPATANIPVLFMTTLTDKANEQLGIDVGAVDYILKPVHPELLRERIRHHLAK